MRPLPTLAAAAALAAALAACGQDEGRVPPGAAQVQDPALDEMSGLVASAAQPGVLWAINDSGSRARLFRLGPDGAALGRVAVDGPWLRDAESLDRWSDGGREWLLIGDVGDNRGWRDDVAVHALAEPARADTTARIAWTLRFRYPDGARDAEAIAVDPVRGDLLVLSKREDRPRLYRVPLSARGATVATAAFVAALPAPLGAEATDMVVLGRAEALVVLTYRGLHLWRRLPGEDWAEALARPPASWPLPSMRKAEALAVSQDGRRLLVGSEHRPTPLWSTPLPASAPAAPALPITP